MSKTAVEKKWSQERSKENSRLYVNFQSKTEAKMVIFAQMKPPITNLNLQSRTKVVGKVVQLNSSPF